MRLGQMQGLDPVRRDAVDSRAVSHKRLACIPATIETIVCSFVASSPCHSLQMGEVHTFTVIVDISLVNQTARNPASTSNDTLILINPTRTPTFCRPASPARLCSHLEYSSKPLHTMPRRSGRSPSPVPPTLPVWPPKLTQAQHDHLLVLATTFALSHGFTLLPPGATIPPTHAFCAPMSLFPTPFPKGLYNCAKDLQPLYNGLYAR